MIRMKATLQNKKKAIWTEPRKCKVPCNLMIMNVNHLNEHKVRTPLSVLPAATQILVHLPPPQQP